MTKKKENNITVTDEKECFVIMPISDCDGYESGHFDRVYNLIIKPSIEKAGFKAYRADDNVSSRLIHIDILKKLIEAPMAICDLTTRNPNVLYELGIRQAFNKPVYLIQEKDTLRIFDINGISTKDYEKGFDYENVVNIQKEICDGIKETYDNADGLNSLISLMGVTAAKIPSQEEIPKLTNESLNKVMLNQILDMNRKLDNLEIKNRLIDMENYVLDSNIIKNEDKNMSFNEKKSMWARERELAREFEIEKELARKRDNELLFRESEREIPLAANKRNVILKNN